MGKTAGKCGWCDRALTQPATGRPRKWCSRFCRQKAYEQRRLDAAMRVGEERARQRQRRTFMA